MDKVDKEEEDDNDSEEEEEEERGEDGVFCGLIPDVTSAFGCDRSVVKEARAVTVCDTAWSIVERGVHSER